MSSEKGSIAVLLADGPADDYEHLWITITEVPLIPADGKAAPVVIFSSPTGLRVDLLDLREEDDRTSRYNRRAGKFLAEGNVEVIYDPFFKTTHAKMMVIDEKLSLLGSTNWTYHALTSNNEVSVLIRSREVARELIDYFVRVKTTGSKD